MYEHFLDSECYKEVLSFTEESFFHGNTEIHFSFIKNAPHFSCHILKNAVVLLGDKLLETFFKMLNSSP